GSVHPFQRREGCSMVGRSAASGHGPGASPPTWRRRDVLRLAGAGGGALLVAACGPAPGGPGEPPPAPARPATVGTPPPPTAAFAAAPKAGGTLRAIKTGDIAPIDPHYHSPGNGLGAWILY